MRVFQLTLFFLLLSLVPISGFTQSCANNPGIVAPHEDTIFFGHPAPHLSIYFQQPGCHSSITDSMFIAKNDPVYGPQAIHFGEVWVNPTRDTIITDLGNITLPTGWGDPMQELIFTGTYSIYYMWPPVYWNDAITLLEDAVEVVPRSRGLIRGVVFDDQNGNCIQDSGEVPLSGMIINPGPRVFTVTNSLGEYELLLPIGVHQFNTWRISSPSQPQANCPTINSDTLFAFDTLNVSFGVQGAPGGESGISGSSGPLRPGFLSYHSCSYSVEADSGSNYSIKIYLNPTLTSWSSQPAWDSVSSDTAFYHFTTPSDSALHGNIFLQSQVPTIPTVSLGQNLQFYAEIALDTTEAYTFDNKFPYTSSITGAYDPNDKMEFAGAGPAGTNYNGDSLLYRIRFQNTGNDTAFNITVVDTFSLFFDLSTLRILGTSHPYTLEIDSNQVVKWHFNNILLPDSTTNEPLSHGWIWYSVEPFPHISRNQMITNQAGIYFDFNPPILTNTTFTRACPTAGFTGNFFGTSQICQGDTGFVGISTSFPFSGLTVDWSTGDQNISYITVTDSGTYSVSISDSANCIGDTTMAFRVPPGPVSIASFNTNLSGFSASFTNTSTNSPSYWHWDFGDGQIDTTNQNPNHTYAGNGSYQVCLISGTGCWQDTTCQTITIQCDPPSALFNHTVSNVDVSFSDQSLQSPTTWLWDFGDGQSSTAQSPTHTYAANGTYQVCLITANACGADTVCNFVTINCQFPVAGFTSQSTNYTATFTDQSQTATSWLWDFGDGQSSTSQSPTHTYAANGTYQVCLITSNACGPDTICDSVSINCPAPQATFSLTQNQDTVHLNAGSTANSMAWNWDFGDGTTGSGQQVSHVFLQNGNYEICLELIDSCGTDTHCDTIFINLQGRGEEAQFGLQLYPNPASEQVTIELNRPAQQLKATLWTVQGKALLFRETNIGGAKQLVLPLQGISAGIYFVEIETELGLVWRKLEVSR